MFDFIRNISPTEVAIIVVILIVIFGPKLIKALGRTSGETLKEVKQIKKEFTKAIDIDDKESGKN